MYLASGSLPLEWGFAAGVKILTKRIAEVEKFAAGAEVCRCSKFAAGVKLTYKLTYNLLS